MTPMAIFFFRVTPRLGPALSSDMLKLSSTDLLRTRHTWNRLEVKASIVKINPSNFKLYIFKCARNIFNSSYCYLVQNPRKKITELANFIVSGS